MTKTRYLVLVSCACVLLSTLVNCEKVTPRQHHLAKRQTVDPLAIYDFFTDDANAINSGLVIFAQVLHWKCSLKIILKLLRRVFSLLVSLLLIMTFILPGLVNQASL